jgi:RNA polymerase sigma-70 factor (ECF subfamily)
MAPEGQEWFVTTRWSVVLAAGRADSTKAGAALEDLCRTYWYPLYAFVRRLGHKPEDAEDLVQAFFAQCIGKNYLAAAKQSRGRFRTFLLIALKRFLANEWDKARTKKRGGTQRLISLDGLEPEQRYALEPADRLSADKLFERRWALTLLETVLKRLENEQNKAGNSAMFERLKAFLVAGGDRVPYAQVAQEVGMSEGGVKVTIHRLRGRYRQLLEEEIAQTVSSPEEIEEERRHLFRVVASE